MNGFCLLFLSHACTVTVTQTLLKKWLTAVIAFDSGPMLLGCESLTFCTSLLTEDSIKENAIGNVHSCSRSHYMLFIYSKCVLQYNMVSPWAWRCVRPRVRAKMLTSCVSKFHLEHVLQTQWFPLRCVHLRSYYQECQVLLAFNTSLD